MISDFGTLFWLQWKRFKGNATYGLTLIGFEVGANRFYLLYVAVFWAFWLYTIWVFLVEQVYQISLVIDPAHAARLRSDIPALIFLAQIVYLVAVLRDSPLKLGAEEIQYVAASPVNPGAVVFIHFIQFLLLPACFAGLISCLITMLLTWASAPALVGFVGLQALVIGVLIFLFSAAVCWIVATVKATMVSRMTQAALWLTIPVAFVLVAVFPQLVLFPGTLWLTTVNTGLTLAVFTWGLTLLCLACGLLITAGSRVNMAAVADNSRMYARIQKLGIFAKLYANDIIFSIRRQSQLARKKHLRLAMSEQAAGCFVLLNRALLSLFRLAPSSVLRLVMRGAVLALSFSLVIRIGGGSHLQTWVLLMMFIIQFRPIELNMLFQQDVGQAFTRQFLPKNLLGIALADSIFPIALVSLGGLAVLFIQPWIAPLTTVVLMLAFATGLEFCQALELVTIPRLFFRRIPYTYSVILCSAVLIGAGYLFKSPSSIVLAAVMINFVLATGLYLGRL